VVRPGAARSSSSSSGGVQDLRRGCWWGRADMLAKLHTTLIKDRLLQGQPKESLRCIDVSPLLCM
jgi:hypothetical protein